MSPASAPGTTSGTAPTNTQHLAALDHAHLWHPFTPMRQWCAPAPGMSSGNPLIIERAEGFELIDTDGNRYIDGVSSLWCNVHGHRVPAIDQAIRDQLDKVAHTTLLGLSSPPAIELAARLVELTAKHLPTEAPETIPGLRKVFYSDAGATAVEVAFKMAVGYWHHTGKPNKRKFIGLAGAYHGDTVGSMSVGFSELFHQPFTSMVFDVDWFPTPDACRPPGCEPTWRELTGRCDLWPSEHPELAKHLTRYCLAELETLLRNQADDTAAIVIEPVMQGAAGMICQPPGFVRGVAKLAREYDVLLIADEVATGFGRTGTMFAYEHDVDDNFRRPDILCLAKGLTGGYLPVAATLATDAIYDAFCGELSERKTLYHGHTYTGNALGCAAALASLDLFEQNDVLANAQRNAELIKTKLDALRNHPNILDIRQRGLMVGIELCKDRSSGGGEPFDFSKRTAAGLCDAMRPQGLILRPLGDVLVLMPAPAMPPAVLERMLDIVVQTLQNFHQS